MTPQDVKNKQRIIYLFIALGFAGLIGAHEVAVNWPSAEDDTTIITVPFILAAAGTLMFRRCRTVGAQAHEGRDFAISSHRRQLHYGSRPILHPLIPKTGAQW